MLASSCVLRPCRHPFFPLLCQGTHLAETRQHDKLRTVSCLCQQHRAPRLGLRWPPKPQNARRTGRPSFCQAMDACAGAGHARWSFDQACRSGEASRRLAQTWQTRLALLMHRRTLTPNRLRTLRMACCGPSQRNAPGAMRAALLSGPGFATSLHAILVGLSRNVSATRSAWRLRSSRSTSTKVVAVRPHARQARSIGTSPCDGAGGPWAAHQ